MGRDEISKSQEPNMCMMVFPSGDVGLLGTEEDDLELELEFEPEEGELG